MAEVPSNRFPTDRSTGGTLRWGSRSKAPGCSPPRADPAPSTPRPRRARAAWTPGKARGQTLRLGAGVTHSSLGWGGDPAAGAGSVTLGRARWVLGGRWRHRGGRWAPGWWRWAFHPRCSHVSPFPAPFPPAPRRLPTPVSSRPARDFPPAARWPLYLF